LDFDRNSTIEKVHGITEIIKGTLEKTVLLCGVPRHHKSRHPGLLFKIRKHLPHAYYKTLESCQTDRIFQVKFKDEITNLRKI
jgi:hypothetical protein